MTRKLLNKIFSTAVSGCMLLVPFQAVNASKGGVVCKDLHSENTVPVVKMNTTRNYGLRRSPVVDLSRFMNNQLPPPRNTNSMNVGRCTSSNVSREYVVPSSPEPDNSESRDIIIDGLLDLEHLWYDYVICRASFNKTPCLDTLSLDKIQGLLTIYNSLTSGNKIRNGSFINIKIDSIKECINVLLEWFRHLKSIEQIYTANFEEIKSKYAV